MKYLLNTKHFEIPRHYNTNTTSYCNSEIPFNMNINDGPLEFIINEVPLYCLCLAAVLSVQVERLEGDKMVLRKQLLSHRHTTSDPARKERGREETDDAQGGDLRLTAEQLRTQVLYTQSIKDTWFCPIYTKTSVDYGSTVWCCKLYTSYYTYTHS